MGIKDRGPGGPQDDETTVAAEEAIVQQAKPATTEVAGETILTTEEVAPVQEPAVSFTAPEALPMPLFIPAAAETAPTVSAVPAQTDTHDAPNRLESAGAPVSQAAKTGSAANVGLSALALGGLLAVLREKRRKDHRGGASEA